MIINIIIYFFLISYNKRGDIKLIMNVICTIFSVIMMKVQRTGLMTINFLQNYHNDVQEDELSLNCFPRQDVTL